MIVASVRFTNVLVVVGGVYLVSKLAKRLLSKRHRTKGTPLTGPPKAHFLLGVSRTLSTATDSADVYGAWAATYGPVYEIPTALGGRRVVLHDPRAVNHFYQAERSVYVKTDSTRKTIANIFGRGLLWAEGEDHKRQRKALTPAFSNAAIRRSTGVFYDSAHKLQGHWDALIENAPDGAIIEVENWMNRVALDSIGIAGFGHDFRSVDGEPSTVADVFDSMALNGGRAATLSLIIFMLGTQLPILAELPTPRNRLFKGLRRTLAGIADDLLAKSRKEKEADTVAEKSIIGLLLKSEEDAAELHMDQAEVVAQMNVLLLAGYETTSISLTWALIELCRNLDQQAKLREELRKFGPQDATWDQLGSSLPYLDAVVLETLRLHPALPDTTRVAQVDDIIPVSEPIHTKSGELVTEIIVPKDTVVTVSIRCMNRSPAFWGPDAAQFNPERWLTFERDGLRASEIQGHRHLITFLDGPRTCLGKQFALAEFKAVLSVLIKNYSFELPDGPDTPIKEVLGLIQRPALASGSKPEIPLRLGYCSARVTGDLDDESLV
ncbi:hypothetical protein MKEN_00001400 [Mycena kentingensis (nom. inval.)]|nr:hypothetical protein MKEN_00001400 [Mycena kentingensis (nom. inval.)]